MRPDKTHEMVAYKPTLALTLDYCFQQGFIVVGIIINPDLRDDWVVLKLHKVDAS